MAASAAAPCAAEAQELLFEGTVLCRDESGSQSRFAANTVVEPLGFGPRAVLSNEVGYYPFRLPARRIIDRPLTVLYHGKNGTDVQRMFVGRENLGAQQNVRLRTLDSRLPCESLEYDLTSGQAKLDSLSASPAPPSRSPAGGILSGIAGLLSGVVLLTRGSEPFGPPPGDICQPGFYCEDRSGDPDSVLFPQDCQILAIQGPLRPLAVASTEAGRFQWLGIGTLSSSPGFSFAPVRDPGAVPMYNPAASEDQSRFRAGVRAGALGPHDFDTDRPDWLVQASAGARLGAMVDVAVTLYGLGQREPLWRAAPGSAKQLCGSIQLATEEWVGALTTSLRVSAMLSVGVSVKPGRQTTHVVHGLSASTDSVRLTSSTTDWVDFDLTAVVDPWPSLRVGVSALNVRGTSIVGATGAAGLRGAGVGASYRLGRLNVGADAVFRPGAGADYSVGLNVIPWSHGILRGGYSTHLNAVSAGFGYRGVSYMFNANERWRTFHSLGFTITW